MKIKVKTLRRVIKEELDLAAELVAAEDDLTAAEAESRQPGSREQRIAARDRMFAARDRVKALKAELSPSDEPNGPKRSPEEQARWNVYGGNPERGWGLGT